MASYPPNEGDGYMGYILQNNGRSNSLAAKVAGGVPVEDMLTASIDIILCESGPFCFSRSPFQICFSSDSLPFPH